VISVILYLWHMWVCVLVTCICGCVISGLLRHARPELCGRPFALQRSIDINVYVIALICHSLIYINVSYMSLFHVYRKRRRRRCSATRKRLQPQMPGCKPWGEGHEHRWWGAGPWVGPGGWRDHRGSCLLMEGHSEGPLCPPSIRACTIRSSGTNHPN
jgi:hypothetical protein